MRDVLAEICDKKREHIKACKQSTPEHVLAEQAQAADAPRGFIKALRHKTDQKQPALIAEIKKASPSRGLIRKDFDPAALAVAYAQNGASCLSVLTDEPYFEGKPDYLKAARAACNLPVLRKDFMLDAYQVTEARAMGADCILLIMAALSDAQARELESAAEAHGMDVLAEVHDDEELDRVLHHLKTPLVGINNRNLKTLEVNLSTSEILAPDLLAEKRLGVCESGITSHADIVRMQKAGLHCFLVGESLMRQRDVGAATKRLLTSG